MKKVKVVSRSRSKWKFIYTKIFPIRRRLKLNYRPFLKLTSIFNRSSTILNKHIGYKFEIHKGKTYQNRIVLKNMVGHKFGEFTRTSDMGADIHDVEKNKLKKKNKNKNK